MATDRDRLDLFLSLLSGVRQTGENRWECLCPCHNDCDRGNGSVTWTPAFAILAQCFSCKAKGKAIAEAINFPVKDLFPPSSRNGNGRHGNTNGRGLPLDWTTIEIRDWPQLVAHYVYEEPDAESTPRYCVIKYSHNGSAKEFTQYRANGPGNWRRGLEEKIGGTKVKIDPMPYRLAEVIDGVATGKTIHIVEGEGDVETLRRHGLVATCNSGGAGHFKRSFAKHFINAVVAIIPDNDDIGRGHARQVAEFLHGKAKDVLIVDLPDLPPKGDVSDWFAAGNTKEDLWALIANVAPWKPSKEDAIKAATSTAVNMTDMGNAQRLVALHGQDMRYVGPWKRWIVWDGKRWCPDDTDESTRNTMEMVKSITKEAAEGDGDFRAILKWALESEGAGRIQSAKRLAQAMMPAMPQDFDKDLWALNAQNGTLDLRTGTLRPHRREDMSMKIISTAYDPEALCPEWDKFLLHIMRGNVNIIKFLQRAAGYSLTGQTVEHQMFILYGTGRNGKSTFVETLQALLADYSQIANFSSWTESKSDSVRDDLADLKGARFVATGEVSITKKLDEQIIKSVTGGDQIKARQLYAAYFTFQPQFKIWMMANHHPRVHGVDPGLWSRLCMIPFSVLIPDEERDLQLKYRLRENELPGVLAWAVRGCLEWQRQGLNPPPEVRASTEDYRSEMDSMANFFRDCCAIHEPFSSLSADLYTMYLDWCTKNDEDKPATRRFFGLRLRERGFKKTTDRQRNNKDVWQGIGIIEYMSPVDRASWEIELACRERKEAARAAAGYDVDENESDVQFVTERQGT